MATITCMCFWCGEKNGKTKHCTTGEDRVATVSYDPCDKCSATFNAGITFFEVQDKPLGEKQPPATVDGTKPLYPTGRYAVVPDEEVKRRFPDKFNDLKETRRAPITPEAYGILFGNGDGST